MGFDRALHRGVALCAGRHIRSGLSMGNPGSLAARVRAAVHSGNLLGAAYDLVDDRSNPGMFSAVVLRNLLERIGREWACWEV